MLTARQVLALCCGAQLTAIRWEDGLPLDVGRAARTEPPALRRALEARDRTCRWLACDTPGTWCTAHHIGGWRNGATTRLADMALVCNLHHFFLHVLGWTITGDPNATLHFHHPAKTSHWIAPSRAPPSPARPDPPASNLNPKPLPNAAAVWPGADTRHAVIGWSRSVRGFSAEPAARRVSRSLPHAILVLMKLEPQMFRDPNSAERMGAPQRW